ncbi:MAG: EamA family transporter [Candidatus Micrarchaeota archaeon]|nr:EamA family transporter [Candidatus Micrarchaeota archaeon]
MKISAKAYVYLLASLLIGSFTPALLVLTQGQNMLEIFMLSSLVSIPFGLAIVAKKKKFGAFAGLLKDRKRLFYLAVAAILSYATFGYGIAYAEQFIGASLTTVLFRLNPLLMLVFLPLMLRERLSGRQLAALGLAFVGIIIGVSGGNLFGIGGDGSVLIMIFAVLLALGYALSGIVIKQQMLDNDVYMCGAAFVMAAFYAIFFAGSGAHLALLSATDMGIVVYIALANIFSYGMYTYALKMLKTTVVTNTYMLSPFLTFVWAALFFGNPITIYCIAIAALAGIGMLIQKDDKIGGSHISRSKAPRHAFTIFDVTGAFATGNGAVQGVIDSGGRVFATKVHRSQAQHIASMVEGKRFSHAYTGNEAFISSESGFVKDILGVGSDEAMVIKAGPIAENDIFFDELNSRIASVA